MVEITIANAEVTSAIVGHTKPKKATKKPSSAAGSKKPKSPRAYPSFYEMISAAIVTLKERTGSSQYAITKFIEEKHSKELPSNFRKLLLVQLKRLVASGKLVKVKNSFKLPAAAKKPSATAVAKPKTAASKPKPKGPAAAKPKPKTAAKSKAKTAPVKAGVKRKAKTESKPVAKVAKTAAKATPGKKKAAVKPKKPVTSVKGAKKPKSVKSPAAKKVAAKKVTAKKAKK